jgi:hypothetical protein
MNLLFTNLKNQVYNTTSNLTTNGVEITAKVGKQKEIPHEFIGHDGNIIKYYFQYDITITNHNDFTIQLESRFYFLS